MLSLGSFGFAAPWLLAGFVVLPLLWRLLRILPPPPARQSFPAVALLGGLMTPRRVPNRMPLWLLLMRLGLAALVILGLAHPLLHPAAALSGDGPLLLVVDDDWAAASDWPARLAVLSEAVEGAERAGTQVLLLTTAQDPHAGRPDLLRPAEARARLAALTPKPWGSDRAGAAKRLAAFGAVSAGTVLYVADGLAGTDDAALLRALAAAGPVRLVRSAPTELPPVLASASEEESGALAVRLLRSPAAAAGHYTVEARGSDGRVLAAEPVDAAAGATETKVSLSLQTELRNQASRIEIEGQRSAASALLLDAGSRRRPVGIIAGTSGEAAQPLLSRRYYIERALSPFAEVRQGPLDTLLQRPISVLVLTDGAAPEPDRLEDWVRKGGTLLRFAGPALAAQAQDRLLPVALRGGGRSLGGALTWEHPVPLAPFDAGSPFAGLAVPADVTVTRQVLAEPSPELSARSWARLADGTPLITAAPLGKGRVILVHTSANPEWSSLAISGLFVEMLRRIDALAGQPATSDPQSASGGTAAPELHLRPDQLLDGFGRLRPAAESPQAQPVAASRFATLPAGPEHPPGLYVQDLHGRDGETRAFNLGDRLGSLDPLAQVPPGVAVESLGRNGTLSEAERDLRPALLGLAFLLALLDLIIGYGLRGWLRPALVVAMLLIGGAAQAQAQAQTRTQGPVPRVQAPQVQAPQVQPSAGGDARVIEATHALHLAYIRTGDSAQDETSRAGLDGLSRVLNERTSAAPAAPMAVDPETDDMVLFPFIYWPITEAEPPLSPAAAERVNRYLATGGILLFDLRDPQTGDGRASGAGAERLRRLLPGVTIPPLAPIPSDHVLTRSFYLLQDFPGRWAGGTLWAEPVRDHPLIDAPAAGRPLDKASDEPINKASDEADDEPGGGGIANDGVSTVLVGSGDWAGAWAVDEAGAPLNAVTPGGEDQREHAYRFGVNLVIYALTGNYKGDQVHVPALLRRLGR